MSEQNSIEFERRLSELIEWTDEHPFMGHVRCVRSLRNIYTVKPFLRAVERRRKSLRKMKEDLV